VEADLVEQLRAGSKDRLAVGRILRHADNVS
jgi:hypothetical protein